MGAIASRNRRARIAKKFRVPKVHEVRYQRALMGAMRRLHDSALAWLRPKLDLVATKKDGARLDAVLSNEFERHVRELSAQLGASVRPAFDQLATAAAANNARAMRSLGLDVRGELGGTLDQIRAWNVSLIRGASDDFAADVRSVLDDPANWAITVDELAAKIQERADVSESRAQLIARDQSSKTNGRINQVRQQSVGISSYEWSGAMDERERDSHIANEGQVFSWLSPPPETGHPTEDIQCRCAAIPIIESDEGDDED